MHNATAYNHAYADSGIFCVHASSHPSQIRELVDVITKEFVGMAGIVDETDLAVCFFLLYLIFSVINKCPVELFFQEGEETVAIDASDEPGKSSGRI